MTTRFDTDRTGMIREEVGSNSLLSGQARLVTLTLPYNVDGAKSFQDLKAKTQANLDSLLQQVENEINRIGRFVDEDGLTTINSEQFFSKAKIGTVL